MSNAIANAAADAKRQYKALVGANEYFTERDVTLEELLARPPESDLDFASIDGGAQVELDQLVRDSELKAEEASAIDEFEAGSNASLDGDESQQPPAD